MEEQIEMIDWNFWVNGLDEELFSVLFFVFIIFMIFKFKGIEVQGKRKYLSILNQFIFLDRGRRYFRILN